MDLRDSFRGLYTSIDELQADLDAWLEFYSNDRPHSGKYCYGKGHALALGAAV